LASTRARTPRCARSWGQVGRRARAIAALLRADLARIAATDASGLDHSTRTSLAVVKSAYQTALDGFALPYGDITVGNYRNTPYVVIQNVGAYLDVPKFLDSDHPIADAADAEAYLARLAAYPGTLDAETDRLRDTAAQRVIAPDFLLDKALAQLEASLADARQGGGLVDLDRPAHEGERHRGRLGRAARSIATGKVVPALERQIAELRRQRQRDLRRGHEHPPRRRSVVRLRCAPAPPRA
jgi:uncharacterized protein (DUF885 family)